MRRVLIVIVSLTLFNTQVAHAACKTDACRRALAWKTGYTAVVLRDGISQEQFLSVISAIRQVGGAVAIEADEVLLGWVPASGAKLVRENPAVRTVLHGPSAYGIDQLPVGRGRDALRYFNRTHSPDFEDTIEAALASGPVEFTQCIPDPPDDPQHDTLSGGNTSHDTAPHQAPKVLAPTLHGAPSSRLPRFASVNTHFWDSTLNLEMRGRVTVQIFRMDSTGAASVYDWSTTHMLFAADSVYDMMNYWAYKASLSSVPLSFTANFKDPFSHYTRSTVPTRTNYEPITHSPTDAYWWVNDALSRHGYGASPITWSNVWEKNEEFNAAALSSSGGPYDHAFSIYLVSNFRADGTSGPTTFSGASYGAFVPILGGTAQIVALNAAGFGLNYLWFVLRHETGHNFWACDEYMAGCLSCGPCAQNGPRPSVLNANCAAGPYADDAYKTLCAVPRVECVMTNTSTENICPSTMQKIGW